MNIVWIEYHIACGMIPHSWILRTMEMYGVAENMRNIIWNIMKCWRTELIAMKQVLGEVKTKRAIFQRDSVLSMIFVLGMIPLRETLQKTKLGYDLGGDKRS